MNNKLLLTGLALTLSCPLMAATPVQGWYFGLMATGSERNSFQTLTYDPIAQIIDSATFKYSMGGGASMMLGYRYNQFRTEGQFFFNTNSLSKLTVNGYEVTKNNDALGFSLKGQTNEYALLLNVLYDLFVADDDTNFIPYLGLGIGYGQVNGHVNFYLNNVEQDYLKLSEKNSNAFGQVIVGANYFLDDYTSFGLDYRYIASLKTNSNSNTNSNPKFNANTLNLVFNYSFDTNE